MKKAIAILLLLICANSAIAEYRVYQYYVRAKYPMPQDGDAYIVTSSLSPTSYLSYHGGEESIDIEMLRTWMCKGYTGNGQKFCDAPYDQNDQSIPVTEQ